LSNPQVPGRSNDLKKIDENEFFRQAALRICGSLDIGKAMADFACYLNGFMPVSVLSLGWLEPDVGIIRNLVSANPSGKTWVMQPIPVPEEVLKFMEERTNEWQEVKIENDPEQDLALKVVLPYHEIIDPSFMYMVLKVEDTLLGAVTIIAQGRKFTPAHARLFSLSREPFVVAMSNALRYQEVIKLKDMLDAENRELSRELLNAKGDEIIGAEYGLHDVMEMVRQVAPLNSPVMLLGETGVGKEVIANAIHRLSSRANAPFIKVNCGAIPESLLDAELFGHEKGAFTGAVAQKRGRFERADNGSIFLDEIAELPSQAQVRLLRVLQNKEIERVGGTQTIPVNVRIISATNKNLEALVRSGDFREDLWYRINIFPIMIPPLRQRTIDIPSLVHHFVEKKCKELKIHTPPTISAKGLARLKAYSWPGNVRELENLIERELIRKRGLEDAGSLLFEHLSLTELSERAGGVFKVPQALLQLDEVNSYHIRKVLHHTKGRIFGVGGAAEILGINPYTLRSRMKKLGIKK
jgi:transcriptional regulator with GAF, ATPase, and Fis domain